MSEKTRNLLDNVCMYLFCMIFVFYGAGYYVDGDYNTEFLSLFFYCMGVATTFFCIAIILYAATAGYKP